jgi:predicted amidohydrolase YtcJ
MNRRLYAAIAMLPLLAIAPSAGHAAAEAPCTADLLIKGAKIITVDGDRIAQAVAVRGDRIVRVGSVAEVSRCLGPRTTVMTLAGKTILPGFIDAHSHIQGMSEVERTMINIQVPPLKDADGIIAALKAAQARKPAGAWLIGQGTYNQPMPTRAQLDEAFPDNPVDLQWSVHDHLINHRAAIAMGMTKAYPDPPKGTTGRYERTADGEVMIVRDATIPLPPIKTSYAEMKEGVRTILQDFYLKRGVTTVSDMSEPDAYRAYQELEAEGRLPTRVRANYFIRYPDKAAALTDMASLMGVHTGFGDERLQLGAVKILLDGVWGTTAAVYKPFWEGSGTSWMPNNRGGTNFDARTLNDMVARLFAAGWQIQIHANGDRAQDMSLDAFEAALAATPRQDPRFRIEHFGNFLVQDPARTAQRLDRMHRLGVIPSIQPAFLWRLTSPNAQEPGMKFFPLKTLIAQGFHPAGGVDTVGTQNFATYPLFSIARAVLRRSKYGVSVQPEEAISVMDAVRMFTIWSAEANFMEGSRGSIAPGKLADFVVLDQDPLSVAPEQLDKIAVAMTIIGGKVAYSRK